MRFRHRPEIIKRASAYSQNKTERSRGYVAAFVDQISISKRACQRLARGEDKHRNKSWKS